MGFSRHFNIAISRLDYALFKLIIRLHHLATFVRIISISKKSPDLLDFPNLKLTKCLFHHYTHITSQTACLFVSTLISGFMVASGSHLAQMLTAAVFSPCNAATYPVKTSSVKSCPFFSLMLALYFLRNSA